MNTFTSNNFNTNIKSGSFQAPVCTTNIGGIIQDLFGSNKHNKDKANGVTPLFMTIEKHKNDHNSDTIAEKLIEKICKSGGGDHTASVNADVGEIMIAQHF